MLFRSYFHTELFVGHSLSALCDSFVLICNCSQISSDKKHLQLSCSARKISRRFNKETGKLELTQPLLPSETYWIREETEKGRVSYLFDYDNCFNFLRNRGFYRILRKGTKLGWDFCHVTGRVIKPADSYSIKDYVTNFTKELKLDDRKQIINMLYRGGPQYLGQEKLSNLEFLQPIFEEPTKTSQNLYFSNCYWEISADGIKEQPLSGITHHIWEEKIISHEVTLEPEELITVTAVDYNNEFGKQFEISIDEKLMDCPFFRFLLYASNFYWRKEDITEDDQMDINRHLLNKMTSIGYLIHDYKNDSEMKAVIAMDGKISEVGTSYGRTGKSLIGVALEYVVPQTYISAKNKDLTNDQFLFDEVTEKTRNVFIDDVRAHFDFEFFFPIITAKMKVNTKFGARFSLSAKDSPKLFITTNHAIDGEGPSFDDRKAFIVFSDYYNDHHKPILDFGKNFFTEWSSYEWNQFYNFIARSEERRVGKEGVSTCSERGGSWQ